jgi:galactose oxidase
MAWVHAHAAVGNGTPGSLTLMGSNLCIEASANNLLLQACNATKTLQSWRMRPGASWLEFVSTPTSQCMDIFGASKTPGTPALTWACHGRSNQRFILRAQNGGHAIVTAFSGMCLAPISAAPGALVVEQNCDGSKAQTWKLADGMWMNAPQKSALNGHCVDVYGVSKAEGAAVIQWACHGGINQAWQLRPSANGAYEWRAQHSDKCLTVSGAGTAPGTALIQSTCNGGKHQRFTPQALGRGYAWVASHSGQCVGIEGNSTQHGARLTQQACEPNNAGQLWQRDGASVAASRWSPLQTISIVPAAAANLPNGKVLLWSAYDRMTYGGDNGKTFTSTLDPITGNATEVLVSKTGHDMFCPGIANLPDGRIHVSGGASSSKTSLYDPHTNAWSAGPAMNVARGYQSATTLSSGEVFTIGGSWSGGSGGKIGEVWSGQGWRRLGNTSTDPIATNDAQGIYRGDNHAWLFADSNGRVFHAGPSQQMHWIDTNTAGAITKAGARNDDTDAMNGNAVMVGERQILIMGGAVNYSNDAAATTARQSAYLIDYSKGTVNTRKVASMSYARAYHNSTVLPNGEVVVNGGQAKPQPFTDDQAPLVPELWSPRTESFLPLQPIASPRTYHSIGLLLNDGRVLSGGGGLCGGCTTNHPDVQVLTPPYLLNPDGTEAARPRIVQVLGLAQAGSSLAVQTDAGISAFSLMRLSSVTHSVNNEQRRVPVNFTVVGTNRYSLALPADRGVLVPGYYMLFAMNAQGVPSTAYTVQVR